MSTTTIETKLCGIPDCGLDILARGYCSKHYYREKRGQGLLSPTTRDKRPAIIIGDVAHLPIGINATKGYAVVDSDFASLEQYNWSLDGHGYPCAWIQGKVRKLHHLIQGVPPTGTVTDHINRDKLDARKANLRFVTHKENSANIPKELFNKRNKG